MTEATFAADSCIIQHQPKSVLCLPIQHQGKPIAILYLENNLVTNAFTDDRLAVLTILASQAAISIENAQLYANLETKVEERTQALSQALDNLKSTQDELIQSEKMAAFSQLQAQGMVEADTVANLLLDLGICDRLEPFLSIFQDAECDNFLKTVRQFVRLQESTRDIKIASERAAKIVFALKTYARFNQTGETIEANIIDGVEVVLTLYQNQIKQGIDVIRNYQELPQIRCYFRFAATSMN